MTERDLILRAQQGEREAFAEIVKLYQARLRGHVARYVEGADDVYDIVQDAFIDAFQHLDTFDTTRELGPWLRAIAHHRVLNFFRSRKVRRATSLSLVDEAIEERVQRAGATGGPGEPEPSDQVEALKRCLSQLEERHREVIRLRYDQGVPVKDIADTLKRSAAAISMMLGRIRTALMKCVEERLEAVNG